MRALILAAGAALALSACSGGDQAENNAMDLEVGNMIVNDVDAMNGATTMDMNLDANVAADAATANAMEQDLTTNDPDTNLANGL